MKLDKLIEDVNQLIEPDKQLSELVELFKYEWETSDHIVKEGGEVHSHIINGKVMTKYELSEMVIQPLGYLNGYAIEPTVSLDIVYDFRKKYDNREFKCHLYISIKPNYDDYITELKEELNRDLSSEEPSISKIIWIDDNTVYISLLLNSAEWNFIEAEDGVELMLEIIRDDYLFYLSEYGVNGAVLFVENQNDYVVIVENPLGDSLDYTRFKLSEYNSLYHKEVNFVNQFNEKCSSNGIYKSEFDLSILEPHYNLLPKDIRDKINLIK